MPYWKLFYHVVWATKERRPSIESRFAVKLHEQIAGNAARLGATAHAIGGIEDHLHLAVSVPPSIALSEFIRQLKGSSSHFVNHELSPAVPFAWQTNYGIISLDSKQLTKIIEYVKEQKKHHALHSTIPILERLGQPTEVGKIKPPSQTQAESL